MGTIIKNAIDEQVGYLKTQVQDLAGYVGGEAQSQRFVFDRIQHIETSLKILKGNIETKQVENMRRIKAIFDQEWPAYAKAMDHGVGGFVGQDIRWQGESGEQDKALGFLAWVEVYGEWNCPDVDDYGIWIYQDKQSGLIRGTACYMHDGDEVVASGGKKEAEFTIGEDWGWDNIRTMLDRVKSSIGVLEEIDEDENDDENEGDCGRGRIFF
jgi:hypothetical protein